MQFLFQLRALKPVEVFRSSSSTTTVRSRPPQKLVRQTPSSKLRVTTRRPTTPYPKSGERRDRWRGSRQKRSRHHVDLLRTGSDNKRKGYLVPTGSRSFGRRITKDKVFAKESSSNNTLWRNHQVILLFPNCTVI